MCGICGFTTTAQTEQAKTRDREAIRRMTDVMAHRGPDGEGFYQDAGIALGHRRLALVDLAAGGQPMVRLTGDKDSKTVSAGAAFGAGATGRAESAAQCPQGDYALVFNGEIYNHRELAARLAAEGWRLCTHSDTEVVLVGYVAWGPERLLDALQGMFAFALWDRPRQQLFCARDPFGIKPFYYATVGGRFVFASEIKSILEYPGCPRRLNRDALAQYLCFQFNPLDETFFEGVFKLPPAHSLVVKPAGAPRLARYWKPRFFLPDSVGEGVAAEDAVCRAVDAAVRASVRRHGAADVEVGSLLSGGVDSSYLSGCLAARAGRPKTFTVGFGEFARPGAASCKDEVASACGVAAGLKADAACHRIARDEYLAAAPLAQWHMDEPLGDPAALALFFVNQLASRQVKAVLSGEGADELFGGYRVYGAPAQAARLGFLPAGVLAAGSRLLGRLNVRGADYLERAAVGTAGWYYTNANGNAFSEAERARLLKGAAGVPGVPGTPFARPQDIVAPLYAEAREQGLDDPTSMQLVDMSCWLVDDILLKADKMSMAHSVECRVPYLDKEVFSVASGLPAAMKAARGQTKRALRQASLSVLPEQWACRDKLGFPVPLAAWLRQADVVAQVRQWFAGPEAQEFFVAEELARLVDDHCAGQDKSRRIWIVWMFLIWYRTYFVDQRRPLSLS